MVNTFRGNPYNGNEEDEDDLMDSFGDIVDLPIIVDNNQDLFETSSLIESDDEESVSGHVGIIFQGGHAIYGVPPPPGANGPNVFGTPYVPSADIYDDTDFDDDDYIPDSFSSLDDDDDDDDYVFNDDGVNNPRDPEQISIHSDDGDSPIEDWDNPVEPDEVIDNSCSDADNEGEHSHAEDVPDNV